MICSFSNKAVEHKRQTGCQDGNACTVSRFKTGGLDVLDVEILCHVLSRVPQHVRE